MIELILSEKKWELEIRRELFILVVNFRHRMIIAEIWQTEVARR